MRIIYFEELIYPGDLPIKIELLDIQGHPMYYFFVEDHPVY